MKDLELDERQRKAVAWIAGGMSGPQAFLKAGFSKSYARKATTRLKQPLYVAALEQERATLRETAPYTATAAVLEIDRQIKGALAAKSPNFMAAASLLTLKCKIYGLIREKIEVVTVDLSGALQRAEQRVLTVTTNGTPAIEVPAVVSDPAIMASQYYLGPGTKHDPLGGD